MEIPSYHLPIPSNIKGSAFPICTRVKELHTSNGFLNHIDDDVTGHLMQVSMEHPKLEIGCNRPPLSLPYADFAGLALSKDTLSKIKKVADLELILQEVNTVREVAFRGQTNCLQALLESLNYSFESADWYHSSGLLPVMVMRSDAFFYLLIYAVHDEAY
jgi:hypothetical protein